MSKGKKTIDEDDTTPALPDYREIPALRKSDLEALIHKQQTAKNKIKVLEEDAKECSEAIKLILEKAKIPGVTCSGYRAVMYESKGADRLSKTRLVELGVSPKIIAKATEEGKPFKALRITAVNEEE